MSGGGRHRSSSYGRHRKSVAVPPLLKGALGAVAAGTLWAAFASESTPTVLAAVSPETPVISAVDAPVPPITTEMRVPSVTVEAITVTPTTTPEPTTTPPVTPEPPSMPTVTRAPAVVATVETPEPEAEVPAQQVTSDLVAAARSFLGDNIPYVWGGKTSAGMDCSGFIWSAMKMAGYDVPYRNSSALRAWTEPVSAANAQAGDLVFWPGHVGLYLGDGKLIDMASSTGTVTERATWSGPSYGRIP